MTVLFSVAAEDVVAEVTDDGAGGERTAVWMRFPGPPPLRWD